jgi:hypothetical protein
MSVDFGTSVREFLECIGDSTESCTTIADFATFISSGIHLKTFLKRRFPQYWWSVFALSDAYFHGAFLFHKFCTDTSILSRLQIDAFDIVQRKNTQVIVRAISELMCLPQSENSPSHSGPLSDDSDICSCLLCRWRKVICVLSPTIHPWAPNRLASSVRRLVADGVPAVAREHVWLILSGGLHLMRTRRPDYASHFPEAFLKCSHLELIDLDISRTFQGYPQWRVKRYDVSTRRILAAYAMRNPSVGYCQGLSYIVGLLVTVVNEEIAFVILCAIIEDGLLPPDYYTSLQGAIIDRRVIEKLIHKFLPELSAILDHQLQDYSFVTIPWNMCLFSTALSMDVSVRLWDFLFAFGPCVLFKTSLSLLRELESGLVTKAISVSDVRARLMEIESTTNANDIALAQEGFPDVTNSLVRMLREELRGPEECPPLSVRHASQSGLTLNSCVSDDSYFGASQPAPVRETSNDREQKKYAIEGLSLFMGVKRR